MKIGSTVYLRDTQIISASSIAAEVKRLCPGTAESVEMPAASGADNLLVIGEVVIAILVLDRQQPTETLEAAFKLNFVWPEARATISEHGCHVVLNVFGEPSGFDEALLTSRALTMATMSFANLTHALAVYWHSSMALLRSDTFAVVIQNVIEELPPIDLWVNYSPWMDQRENSIGLFSIGLQGFTGYEIELVPRKEPLGPIFQRAISLTGYLLEKGPVLNEGNTIGYTETERLQVRFADDGKGEKVLQVTTEQVK